MPQTSSALFLIQIQIEIKQILAWVALEDFCFILTLIWIENKRILAKAVPDQFSFSFNSNLDRKSNKFQPGLPQTIFLLFLIRNWIELEQILAWAIPNGNALRLL